MSRSGSVCRSTIRGSFQNSGVMSASFRSASGRSESSAGNSAGYATPAEGDDESCDLELEREVDRAVQILSRLEEEFGNSANTNDAMDNSAGTFSSWRGDRIDRKSYMPHFKRPKLGHGVAANCFRKYPRMYACTCGIVLPLWFLIGLCLLCGNFLGGFEYEAELDENDAAMRARRVAITYEEMLSDTIHNLPVLCYMLYRNGTNQDDLDDAFALITAREQSISEWINFSDWIENQPSLTDQPIMNVTQFGEFMYTCGKEANHYAGHFLQGYFGDIAVDMDGDNLLTFNWNRCMNRTHLFQTNRILYPSDKDVLLSQPINQSDYYAALWNQDFERRHQEYLAIEMAKNPNGTTDFKRVQAFNRSLYEATGRNGCVTNVAASGWFWFTVMTTLGYGNQAPISRGGRILVFSLGFICIIMFATILATTGQIVTHFVYDIAGRLRFKILLKKEVMTVIWGFLWVSWQVFMTVMFMEWNQRRLFTRIRWQDAYWFAYISTTTVGLGDYYQTPEVIYNNDLLYFSLSYLFGFVLLSTFLTELANALAQYVPDISVELGKRLKHVGPIPYLLDGVRRDDNPSRQNAQEKDEDHSRTRARLDFDS